MKRERALHLSAVCTVRQSTSSRNARCRAAAKLICLCNCFVCVCGVWSRHFLKCPIINGVCVCVCVCVCMCVCVCVCVVFDDWTLQRCPIINVMASYSPNDSFVSAVCVSVCVCLCLSLPL